jgi:GTP cyclohydrolase I
MEMRGVEKSGAMTTTSELRGCFEDQRVREEFFDLLKRE